MSDSNLLFSKLLDSSINAVMILEAIEDEKNNIVDFQWTYVNPKVEEYLKIPQNKFMEGTLLTLMPGNMEDGLFDKYVSVVKNSSNIDIEHRYQRDGINAWFRITACAYENNLLITFLDITLKKESEERLRQSQSLFKLISENSLDFISIHNSRGDYIFASPSCKSLLGYHPEELVGRNAYELFHSEDLEFIRKHAHIPLLDGTEETITHEYRILKKDGTPLWVETKSRLLPQEFDNSNHILASTRSIHERKMVESHVSRLALEYERVFNGTMDAIALIRIEPNGEFQFARANKIFQSRTGIPAEKLISSRVEDVIHDDRSHIWIQSLSRCLKEGVLTIQDSYSYDGRSVDWLLTFTPFQEFGTYRYIIVTCRDITEQKRTQEELNQYRKDLEESNLKLKRALIESERAIEIKSEFLANMSHEVRTPLNGILGMTDLLKDSNLTEDQSGFVDVIQSSGKILLRIINDILDFSKMEAGRLRLEIQKFKIQEIVESSLKIFQEKANRKKIELYYSIPQEVPSILLGDQGRVLQILLNLIGNAVKFSDSGNINIRLNLIEVDRQGHYEIIFRVIDTGIGVPPDKVNLLFKPFSQIDGSLTRKYEGTGLGLSICDRLVKLMNGRIGYKPNPNGGSEFWFTSKFQVPDSDDKVTQFSSSILDISLEDINKITSTKSNEAQILIVEDNSVNQKVARSLLRKIGYDADLAENGKQALEMIQRKSYKLVFMDIQMPVMNGLDATKKIRELERDLNIPKVNIVAMTAHVSEEDRNSCFEAGMDDYISKPIERSNLESIILKWT